MPCRERQSPFTLDHMADASWVATLALPDDVGGNLLPAADLAAPLTCIQVGGILYCVAEAVIPLSHMKNCPFSELVRARLRGVRGGGFPWNHPRAPMQYGVVLNLQSSTVVADGVATCLKTAVLGYRIAKPHS